MRIKGLQMENFQDYKKCSMLIGTAFCDWKCCKECGQNICQNSSLAQSPYVDIADEELVNLYMNNPINSAIIFGGLEPFEQYEEMFNLIKLFRTKTNDDIIIYTGFYKEEIEDKIQQLCKFNNIIVKYGRFIPNAKHKFDDILGVELASSNQYAEKIS